MAAAPPPPDPRLLLALLLLLLQPLPPPLLCAAAGPELGRRFAERKRCADPECSMLMCRGKAMKDFKGPDCRFVNFKKGEAVYVYYKLIGKSTELWAGSVGSDFGYFPKDLLEVNHNYTNEELELPTDETDFVCFDGGRDDFDNYNVDELLKSSKETISLDALEADNVELSIEKDKEALTITEEVDSFLIEGTEGTRVDSSASSHEENSQGDQTAHEHLQGTLNERLKGLESENTKNTSTAQGETSQLDKESKEVDAYTLLDRELSINLKTKFGSTADAVVSDDEVTRLVTSSEDDFNEGLSINAHDSDKESDFVDPSEEIPLLSFMAEEEESLGDSDADENNSFESKNHEFDENEGDAFTKSGDSMNVDRFESEQTKEKQDEVMLISKREAPTAQLEDFSKELLRNEPIGARDPGSEEKANKTDARDPGSEEKANKTEELEEPLMADEMVLHTEELKSTTVPDPHALPSPQDGLKTKPSVESKQDALGLPAGDVNKSPERVPLAEIEKEEKKFEDDTLEEISGSDLKHKKLWEKMKEKGRDQYKPSADVPTKPVEEVQNGSQSDTGDTKLLKAKLEHGMPSVEKEILRHEEDSKQKGEAEHENQKPASFKEEPEIKGRNMKETPAGEGDPSHRGAQGTAHTEDEDSNKDLDAEDDADLKQMEEELLEDENAASAKLLHARVANVQGNTLDIERRNPELKVPSEAFSVTADPTYETGEETNSFSEEAKKIISMQDEHKTGNKEFDVPANEDAELDEMEHTAEDDEESSEAEEPSSVEEYNFKSSDMEDSSDFHQRKDHVPEDIPQRGSKEKQNITDTGNDHQQSARFPSPADISAAKNDTVTEYSESVKRLTIIRGFLDEKRVMRLYKYLGLQHVIKIEAMFHDMKVEMELARKASNNNEDIEKALDQILEFSESNIMDVVGKVLDSRVAENKEEVVKEMDLYDEESALMDDIQELIYSLRSKYSSASESVPLASFLEQEDDQLNLVATLPEDIRPGPDFHGLPWEPVIITALVGIATLAVIFWRTCLSVTFFFFLVTEKQLAEKIKNLLQEKTEILDKMSEYDEKIKQAKESVKAAQEQKNILSDETAGLKDTVKGLEEANRKLDDKIRSLHSMLETERKQNEKKQKKVRAIILRSCTVQIALNEAKLNEEKVKSELQHVQEENARLKKSKEQLLKEAEGWSERHTELSEQIKLYQKSQKDIEEALAYKENEIEVLTNCIMQLKQLDIDSSSDAKKDGEGHEWSRGDDLANGELPGTNEKMKTQIKQMMDVSRVKTMLSIVEEDRNLLQTLKWHNSSLCNFLSTFSLIFASLTEQIKKLEHDSCSLQSAKARLENECKTLQQKVEILGELYQQKEMALQKKLTQEEYERQEKEQKLSAADEKAVLAIEEVKVYKQRIQDMEEELQKTERSYKNQIAAHEKKAHDNWLIARSAERALAEEKREAANLRQKLIEVNQKIVMLQRPLIVKPTPGRPDRQVPPRRGPLSRDGSFGPSPVSGGNPSPTQMIEVPGRPLSAPRREGSRGEFGKHITKTYMALSTDLGPAVASLISSGPRTSSPSTAMDRANVSPKGPPSFPGTPIMTSPVMGPPPPPPVRYGPPPAPLRGHFGPRPLPVPLVRGAPLPPPAARDFLPGPPLGMRDLPPGPLPPPPDPRAYGRGHPSFRPLGPPGPRDYPQGPQLPPPGSRDYTPSPSRDLPLAAPRDYPAGPPPAPAGSKDYTQPPAQKP
uniref:Transport and Golgi organization protein 1 homolog n=1 Tax=Anas platyrhynchos platyrhynchos TaxID=8840 RepID=U3IFE5_ANAPP